MITIKNAHEALIKSQGHVLVYGSTGTGKRELLKTTTIPDSRYFDFSSLCKLTCYPDLPFLCRTNEGIYLDDILDAKESTVILDYVEFPQDLNGSVMNFLLKTMWARGKRVIAVAFPSYTLEHFKPLFDCEILTERVNENFYCSVSFKSK